MNFLSKIFGKDDKDKDKATFTAATREAQASANPQPAPPPVAKRPQPADTGYNLKEVHFVLGKQTQHGSNADRALYSLSDRPFTKCASRQTMMESIYRHYGSK